MSHAKGCLFHQSPRCDARAATVPAGIYDTSAWISQTCKTPMSGISALDHVFVDVACWVQLITMDMF